VIEMNRKMAISAIELYNPSGSDAHVDLVLTLNKDAAKSFQVRILGENTLMGSNIHAVDLDAKSVRALRRACTKWLRKEVTIEQGK